MSHAGITTCVGCHGPTITGASFAGITNDHRDAADLADGRERAHSVRDRLRELPSRLDAGGPRARERDASAIPGTLFATPVPTTAQIHSRRHERLHATATRAADQWMDMSANYPISPAALDGERRRPSTWASRRGPARPRARTNLVDAAHPTSGDCSQCHTSTDYFDGPGSSPRTTSRPRRPRTCTNCHTGTDFSVLPTLTEHPRLRAEHDRELHAVPRQRRRAELRDPGGELLDRAAAREPRADDRRLRDLPRRRGLEHRGDAGRRTAPSSRARR